MQRKYDIIVYGATGFTGALVAEYLAKNYHQSVKFAIAGRSQSKLQTVRSNLPEAGRNIDIIVADAGDHDALDAMTRQTRLVLTTAGPFARFGRPLVESCVRNRTHYVDSTGEPTFISSILELHEEAQRNETMIIPSCGFDSIPSDLGALLVTSHIAKTRNLKTDDVTLSVISAKGAASGGTIHSAMALMESDWATLKKIADPYVMVGDTESKGALVPVSERPTVRRANWFIDSLNGWQTANIMAPGNSAYVRRTWSLLKGAYGPRFNYGETMWTRNVFSALFISALVNGGAALLVMLPPLRWLIKWLVPQGTGPSRRVMETGHMYAKLVGVDSAGGKAVADVKIDIDPGYLGTAQMLVECAIAVLDKLDGKGDPGYFGTLNGGILTAATAVGMGAISRLNKSGMTFTVRDA